MSDRRLLRALLSAAVLAAGCAAGNPYRAEPLPPDVETVSTTNPVTQLTARIEDGLLAIDLLRTSRNRIRSRPVFRERETDYRPLADAAELVFSPIALAGYAALSPVLVPLDAMGAFVSYVDGYPDPRPWGLVESLATGFLPGVTTHFYDEGQKAGRPTGNFIRGEWTPDERWARKPVGGAKVELRTTDGRTIAHILTDEAGHGTIFLRNLRDEIAPSFVDGGPARLSLAFGGVVREFEVRPGDVE
ncbi:MAG: hypothetical protein HY720_23015 [Planctomycetes bacterium]|nr:hypothetical protein [Planctomycetota bacterium]